MDEEKALNNKQDLAVDLAVRGLTDVEIAKRIGVSRQIVNTWRNHDADFMYELAMRRDAMREKHQDSLNLLIEKAIEIIRKAMEEGDAKTQLQAAMYVLRISGLKGYPNAGGASSRVETEKILIENSLFQVVKEMGFG